MGVADDGDDDEPAHLLWVLNAGRVFITMSLVRYIVRECRPRDNCEGTRSRGTKKNEKTRAKNAEKKRSCCVRESTGEMGHREQIFTRCVYVWLVLLHEVVEMLQ